MSRRAAAAAALALTSCEPSGTHGTGIGDKY